VFGWAAKRRGSILSPQKLQILPGSIFFMSLFGLVSVGNFFVVFDLLKSIGWLRVTRPTSNSL
jgi:hypothetical protein